MEENKKIILNEVNVLNIMKDIITNRIDNVQYYITNVLNLNYKKYLLKVDVIKEKHPDLYLEYEEKVKEYYNEVKENIKIAFLYIATYKKYGIIYSDGSERKFDYFDMYVICNKYFNNYKKSDLLKILEELDKELIYMNLKLNLLEVRFLINMMYNKTVTIDRFDVHLNKEYVYNEELNGLNIDEKRKLISFIEENNIPFTLGNYNYGSKKMIKQRNNKNDIFKIEFPINSNDVIIDECKKMK